MPQDRPEPGSASDWLARARGDLAIAKAPLPEGAFYADYSTLNCQIFWHFNRRLPQQALIASIKSGDA